MFGRSLSRVFRALFDYRNYLSVVKAPFVYVNPIQDFLQGYILQKGNYPHIVHLQTPIGVNSIEILNSLDTFTINEIFCWEIYYTDNQPKIVVDIGSNIGVSELYFLSRNNSNIVYGFEPVPNLYEQLQNNISKFRDRAFNQKVAISNINGTSQMGVESSGRYGGIGVKSESQITVETIDINFALSQVLDSHDFIDILKMDIEGLEEIAINSIDLDILSRIKLIYVEAGDDNKFFPQNLKKSFKHFSHRGICKYVNTLL
jgi:FkbM family methyltransferase